MPMCVDIFYDVPYFHCHQLCLFRSRGAHGRTPRPDALSRKESANEVCGLVRHEKDIFSQLDRSVGRAVGLFVTLRKVALMLDASALASRVLPVPGGPYSRTPCTKGAKGTGNARASACEESTHATSLDGWIGGWMDDGWMMDGWTDDGWTDDEWMMDGRWTGGLVEGWMDRWVAKRTAAGYVRLGGLFRSIDHKNSPWRDRDSFTTLNEDRGTVHGRCSKHSTGHS